MLQAAPRADFRRDATSDRSSEGLPQPLDIGLSKRKVKKLYN
jgi:hypothetical protein